MIAVMLGYGQLASLRGERARPVTDHMSPNDADFLHRVGIEMIGDE